MVSNTYILDDLDIEDIINFTISEFLNNDSIIRISHRFSTIINDDKNSRYAIENMYEVAYFLDDMHVVVRSHLLPRKGGVIEKDDGNYYNDKSFFTMSDREDMDNLKSSINYYTEKVIENLQKLSSNKITLTVDVYTNEDMIEDLIQREEK